ncbi:MAG: DUF4350 domain-containing protein [Candidatus Hydrothermarchaeota archaeon]
MRKARLSLLLLVILLGGCIKNTEKKILWDESHLETYSIEKIGMFGYSKLREDLETLGYKSFSHKKGKITDIVLNQYDALVIAWPTSKFSGEEILAIQKWVKDGGGLFLIGSSSSEAVVYLNSLSRNYGVTFRHTMVCDRINDGSVYKPKIQNLVPHPITENVSYFVVYYGSSLETIDPSMILATTSENGWADVNLDGEYQPGEKKGRIPVLASYIDREGRIVFISDGDLFSDVFIEEHDNKKLAINIIKWLLKED